MICYFLSNLLKMCFIVHIFFCVLFLYIVIHNKQKVLRSLRNKMGIIYAFMKTVCPTGYHHNDFVATRPLGHSMYGLPMCMSCHKAIRAKTGWANHCFHDCRHRYKYIYICIAILIDFIILLQYFQTVIIKL